MPNPCMTLYQNEVAKGMTKGEHTFVGTYVRTYIRTGQTNIPSITPLCEGIKGNIFSIFLRIETETRKSKRK